MRGAPRLCHPGLARAAALGLRCPPCSPRARERSPPSSSRASPSRRTTASSISGSLPIRRQDTELTNSAALLLDFDGAPLWKGLYPSVPSCAASGSGQRCSTTEFRLGQDMYTPSASIWSPQPEPGQRPYAGWLYVGGTGRVASPTVSDAVTLEVGVTGGPSLAQQIQTAWHALIHYPQPLGWSHQIPFQPGILVAADHQREVLRATIGGVPVMSFVPDVAASVGNVLTGASAGAEARFGYGVSTPWSVGIRAPSTPFEVYGLASLHENLVIEELFLDEPSSHPDQRVVKEPFVTQYEIGGGVRIHALRLEYRGITRTREYLTGPPQRGYGLLTVGMRFGW